MKTPTSKEIADFWADSFEFSRLCFERYEAFAEAADSFRDNGQRYKGSYYESIAMQQLVLSINAIDRVLN